MSLIGNMEGKVALVTGAASGLGRATALALAGAGADVAIADINADGLAETASAVRALSKRVEVLAGDLSLPETAPAFVAKTIAAFGRLDALCSVAGIVGFFHSPTVSPEQWAKTLAVNLSAPFFLFQAAIPHLLESGGAVVNVVSAAAFVGSAYLAPYSASKGGLLQLTKSLAMEYTHKNVRINAVAPGGMATGMMAMNFPEDLDFTLVQRFSGLRGLVEIEEVAGLIAYLASPAAQSFHGACINIDRGVTAG